MVKLLGQRGSYSPIGMDIGRRGVRLVQLVRGPSRARDRGAGDWRVFKAFCWDWSSGREGGARGGPPPEPAPIEPRGSMAAALRSEERVLELAERIKRFLRQNEFRGREVVAGLSSPEVELHALELPAQDESGSAEGLRQAAHWEIERLMSYAPGTVASDFWLLPAADRGPMGRTKSEPAGPRNPGQPTAIGVAAEKAVISGVWKMCRAAGVVCRRLDAGLCGLARCGAWLRRGVAVEDGLSSSDDEAATREIWGLLDLGDHQIRLALCVRDVPVLVRGFDTGGSRWIRRISEALGLSASAAEIHLRDHGIQPLRRGHAGEEERGVRGDDPGGPGAPSAHLGGIIRNILREELDTLCAEIERSYRYALQCYPDHRVSELILMGGGSELRDLDGYLKERLGIAVHAAVKRGRPAATDSGGAGTFLTAAEAAAGRYSLGALCGAIGLALPAEEPRMGARVPARRRSGRVPTPG